jgi:hypothetical protein
MQLTRSMNGLSQDEQPAVMSQGIAVVLARLEAPQ